METRLYCPPPYGTLSISPLNILTLLSLEGFILDKLVSESLHEENIMFCAAETQGISKQKWDCLNYSLDILQTTG